MIFKGPISSLGLLLNGHILRNIAHRHLIFFWWSQKGLFLLFKTYFMTKRVQKLEKKVNKKYA